MGKASGLISQIFHGASAAEGLCGLFSSLHSFRQERMERDENTISAVEGHGANLLAHDAQLVHSLSTPVRHATGTGSMLHYFTLLHSGLCPYSSWKCAGWHGWRLRRNGEIVSFLQN